MNTLCLSRSQSLFFYCPILESIFKEGLMYSAEGTVSGGSMRYVRKKKKKDKLLKIPFIFLANRKLFEFVTSPSCHPYDIIVFMLTYRYVLRSLPFVSSSPYRLSTSISLSCLPFSSPSFFALPKNQISNSG